MAWGRGRQRALNPRDATPNANAEGPNVPPQSVGPTSSTNRVGNFVMDASAWSGWPEDPVWMTPPLEEFSGGNGLSGGQFSGYGYGRQNAAGYMRRVATVMTCSDLNGRQLASFPAYAVKGREVRDLPSWYVNSPEPTLYSDWSAFMKAACNSYWLAGEVILWAVDRYRSNGFPARFAVLNPHKVTQDVDGEWYLNGGTHLDRRDVCHVPYQLLPGCRRGVGPLEWSASAVIDAAQLDAYASQIARYGVWGILKAPGELKKDQADEMRAQWAASRLANVGQPAVTSGGVEYETITMSPKDLALLDLKWFDHQTIAAAMGVPAVLVNLPQATGLTYQSTLMLADFHWRATLRPAAQSFSGALSRWALPLGTSIEFNPDRYVQPDLESRSRAYSTLFNIFDPDTGERAITVDEIRLAERFAPLARTGSIEEADPSSIGGAAA